MTKPLFTTFFCLSYILMFNACAKKNTSVPKTNTILMQPKEITYLALGDSYTIGEAVPLADNFPNQLAKALNLDSVLVSAPQIVAKTGYTTAELLEAINKTTFRNKYDLVTLLIGVNNQYRNYDITIFRTDFKKLLNLSINFASGNTKKVYVISIPDWGITPFAKNSNRNDTQIAQEIDAYNAICKEEAEKLNVKFVDITPISRLAKTDLSLIANDGLHPSTKMYSLWVKDLIKNVNLKL